MKKLPNVVVCSIALVLLIVAVAASGGCSLVEDLMSKPEAKEWLDNQKDKVLEGVGDKIDEKLDDVFPRRAEETEETTEDEAEAGR